MGQKSVNIHLSSIGENRSKAAPRRWEKIGQKPPLAGGQKSVNIHLSSVGEIWQKILQKSGEKFSDGKGENRAKILPCKRRNRAKIPLRQGKKSSENSPPRRGKIGKKADKKPSQKPV